MKQPKKLRFEKWQTPMMGVSGTIRTVPENYYVADVSTKGRLFFKGIERMTRDVDHRYIGRWWAIHKKR